MRPRGSVIELGDHSMISAIKKFNSYAEKVEDFLLKYIVVVMTLAIFLQVIMRYVFNNSLTWSEEFATFSFMWLTWIGASNGVKKQSHIRILLMVQKLKGKYFHIAMMVIDVVWLLFTFFLVKYGIAMVRLAYFNRRISAALEIPMTVMYSAVVIGGLLMFIGLLGSISERWLLAMKGEEVTG